MQPIFRTGCRDGEHPDPRALKSCLGALALVGWLAATPAGAVEPLAAAEVGALAQCATIANDKQRLECYDALAARRAPPGRSLSVVEGPRQAPVQPVDADASPQPPTGPAAETAAPQIRVAGSFGFGVGDHNGSFHVQSGVLKLQSAAGSSGNLASGQIWVDRWLAEDWSIGLEYVALRNEGRLGVVLPKGVSILTDPAYATAQVKVRADFGFANIAYRAASGTVHPFIGAGIGIGYGHASAGFSFNNAFLGSLTQVVEAKKPVVGVQGFTGVAFDLGRQAYFEIMPRVILVNGHPIGVDQQYMDFGVSGVLGWRF
jgi:hypothetical protein